jgi:formamidopyrimidine-DNA glycosylase
MSIELPEAHILASQMNQKLCGEQAAEVQLKNYVRLQKIGCVNRNLADYDRLVGGNVAQVLSRGLVIRVKLDNGWNLLLAPEYGGKILYQPKGSAPPEKFHFKLAFKSQNGFTVTLTGLGGIQAFADKALSESYMYRRDFSNVPSPLNDAEFTFEAFSKALSEKSVNVKAAMVGKDAVVVGLSNSAFQDVIFRAGIHPKRKASSLAGQTRALYDAIRFVVQERIRLGGKTQFVDFYGKQGAYTPAMGTNMKGQKCGACGSNVEALSLGGGQVFFCPTCQT